MIDVIHRLRGILWVWLDLNFQGGMFGLANFLVYLEEALHKWFLLEATLQHADRINTSKA